MTTDDEAATSPFDSSVESTRTEPALAPGSTATTVSPGPRVDPGALGLGAFALTTFVLSVANAGWIPSAGAVLGLALFYGGIVQFAAGIWEFANKNTFGATAFCSFGGFWLSFWYLEVATPATAIGAHGVGVFLLAWGIFTLYMCVASYRTNGSIFAVFVALTLTFFALAIGALADSTTLSHLGGYLGVATAIIAWYGSFAVVFNSTAGRAVLPVWPRR